MPPGLIGLVEAHLHAVAQLRHASRHRSGQVEVRAENDFSIGDAAGVRSISDGQ